MSGNSEIPSRSDLCSEDVISRDTCTRFYECGYCKYEDNDINTIKDLCKMKGCYKHINLFKPLFPPTPINIIIIIICSISILLYLFSNRFKKVGAMLFITVFIFFILGFFKIGPFIYFWIKELDICPSLLNGVICSIPKGKHYMYLDHSDQLISAGKQCIYTVSKYDDCPPTYPIDMEELFENPQKGWLGCAFGGGKKDCKKCCK